MARLRVQYSLSAGRVTGRPPSARPTPPSTIVTVTAGGQPADRMGASGREGG
jgi:hypothetical protein